MLRDTGALSLIILAVALLGVILVISDRALSHSPRGVPTADLSTLQGTAEDPPDAVVLSSPRSTQTPQRPSKS